MNTTPVVSLIVPDNHRRHNHGHSPLSRTLVVIATTKCLHPTAIGMSRYLGQYSLNNINHLLAIIRNVRWYSSTNLPPCSQHPSGQQRMKQQRRLYLRVQLLDKVSTALAAGLGFGVVMTGLHARE